MKRLQKKFGWSKRHIWGLAIFLFVGVLQTFIANEDYTICFNKELNSTGVQECQKGLPPLIPYSYNTLDKENRSVGPFHKQQVSSLYYRHWLGTDEIGRDVLAGLLAGSAVALKIGLLSVLLALLIGIIFGYLSGYVGDKGFKLSPVLMVLYVLLLCLAGFYFYYGSSSMKFIASFVALLFSFLAVSKSRDYSANAKVVSLPLDLIIMRAIEIFRAIPTLFVLLVLLGIIRNPSLSSIIVVIALVRWPNITRYIRAEILNIKEEQFVKSAQALGLSPFRIFIDQILPLSLSPVIVTSAFGVSTAILFESTLSFLGIGLPADQVTWGTFLNSARSNFDHWWLAVFPGLMIYLVIYLFNSIGDSVSSKLRH